MALAELSHNVTLSILWKLHIQIVHIWYENKCVFVYPRKLYLGQFVSMCRLHADKSPSTQWPFSWSHAHAHLPIQRFTIGRSYAMLPNHRPVKMFRHSHWLKSHDLCLDRPGFLHFTMQITKPFPKSNKCFWINFCVVYIMTKVFADTTYYHIYPYVFIINWHYSLIHVLHFTIIW